MYFLYFNFSQKVYLMSLWQDLGSTTILVVFNLFENLIFNHFGHFYFKKLLKYLFVLVISNTHSKGFSRLKSHSTTINCQLVTIKCHFTFLLFYKHIILILNLTISNIFTQAHISIPAIQNVLIKTTMSNENNQKQSFQTAF